MTLMGQPVRPAVSAPDAEGGLRPSAFPLARRSLLGGVAAVLGGGTGRAQDGDGSLARVVRAGRLRFAISAWMSILADIPEEPDPILADPFNEAVARLIAERMGLRFETWQAPRVEAAFERLSTDEADIAIAPILNRRSARTVMFTSPHAMLDTVILSTGPETRLRRIEQLAGRRLGIVTRMAAAIEERRMLLDGLVLVQYPGLVDLAAALDAGEVNTALVTSIQARSMIRRRPAAGLRVLLTVSSHAFGPAVAYGNHDLLRAVSAIMSDLLQDGTIAGLFRRETGLPYIPLADF